MARANTLTGEGSRAMNVRLTKEMGAFVKNGSANQGSSEAAFVRSLIISAMAKEVKEKEIQTA